MMKKATIEITKRGAEWDWKVRDSNGYALDGNEGYRSFGSAQKDAEAAKKRIEQQ